MIKKNILITGCGGMLGAAVYRKALEKYGETFVYATDIDLNEPWLTKLDVRNIEEYEEVVKKCNPLIIIHLAALTDLEYCEKNPNDAWATNALGVENAVKISQKYGVILVYISTAGVFDGEKDEYTDFDIPNPINVYGKSKYHGELFVQENLKNYYIFRAGWMMGGGPKKDKKFINKIYKQIKNGSKELFIVDDKLGTPTYTIDFANSIFSMIDAGNFGLYNNVCDGNCSRFEVAQEFIKLLDLSSQIKLHKVSSDYFQEEYFVKRPKSERLLNIELKKKNINIIRTWKTCLAEYVEEFKRDLL